MEIAVQGRIVGALIALHATAARADDVTTASSARALFVSRGLSPEAALAIQDAAARAVGLELLDDREIESLLAREAARLGPDRERAAADALRQAREDFVELRLASATRSFDAALAALLDDGRGPASSAAVAQVFFERGLVALASRDVRAARRDLRIAATIAPGLAPDPDRYGPPALRAWAEARRAVAASPEVTFVIDWAPTDARVELDGVPVGHEVRARGVGPHLLTVARLGYRARSELITGGPRRVERDVVLDRAEGALLAQHALEAWQRRDIERARLDGERGVLVARSLAITRVVEAVGVGDDAIDLTLYDGGSGAVLRAVHGARNAWEPHPWAQVAAALAGRVLAPQPAPSLTLAAPTVVEPGAPIHLEVLLTDPAARVDAVAARCGAARAERPIAGSARLELTLDAPADEGAIACEVVASRAGEALVRAPSAGRAVVHVEQPTSPWYRSWVLWAVIGGAVVGGAAISFAVLEPPEQVLVVHGP